MITATETDEEHEVVTDTAEDSVDEDIADDDPLHEEVYNNDLERIIDQAIKSCKEKGKPSNGIPELVFCIPCIHPKHKVTNTLDKGYFSIKGNQLEKMSVNQAMNWADTNLQKSNCGHLGCGVTISECLQDYVVGDILCYQCKGIQPVDAQTACPDHPDTKLDYLVTVALSQVVNWYIWRARNKVLRNIPLPFAELDIHPMSQFFPVSILQGLLFHPWVKSKSQDLLVNLLETPGQTELNGLVMMLSQNDKAGDITGLKDRAKVGGLCETGKQLLENQKLQNWLKGLLHENQKLMRNKRKSDELQLNFIPFKKRKLHEVGNRQSFDTVQGTNFDDEKSGKLKGGFTDISISQKMYTSHLIANTGPEWKKEAENDKVDTVVTRSWDDQFYCVECKGQKRHSIFKG